MPHSNGQVIFGNDNIVLGKVKNADIGRERGQKGNTEAKRDGGKQTATETNYYYVICCWQPIVHNSSEISEQYQAPVTKLKDFQPGLAIRAVQ